MTDSLVTGKVSPKGSSCGFVGISTGTVNLTNCIYAGDGGEEDWFNSYPLVSGGTVNVENCYTTYADESSGFEGVVYKSALVPAKFERVQKQIENVAPYVDKILSYQYLGIMNPADSPSFAGHPDSVKLYEDYKLYLSK